MSPSFAVKNDEKPCFRTIAKIDYAATAVSPVVKPFQELQPLSGGIDRLDPSGEVGITVAGESRREA